MTSTAHESAKGTRGITDECPGAAQGNTTIDSRRLLNGRDTVDIAHQGELYRLRLTRQGKLILTK